MTEQDKKLKTAEEFVRKVISEDFHQKVTKQTVRDVALKVARAIPSSAPEKRKAA